MKFHIKDDKRTARRLIPQRKHYRPMRFVGIGVIVMLVLIFLLYKLMVK